MKRFSESRARSFLILFGPEEADQTISLLKPPWSSEGKVNQKCSGLRLDHQIRKISPFLMVDLQAPKNFQFQHSSGNRASTCQEFGGGSYSGEETGQKWNEMVTVRGRVPVNIGPVATGSGATERSSQQRRSRQCILHDNFQRQGTSLVAKLRASEFFVRPSLPLRW
jgi:hypothetical protein